MSDYKPTDEELKKWRKMEAEHTRDRIKQEQIVMQHVHEFGRGYYPALIKMENRLMRK
jgi:hypothetical protein